MARQTTRRDIFWGYLAQGLNIGAGLILLPVILRHLPAEDVGLWFVFITLAGLAQLLEFGFQPTLARNTAYIYAGANALTKSGIPENFISQNTINIGLLSELIAASRYIYRIVAAFACLVLLLGGTIYVFTLLTPKQNHLTSIFAWLTFAAGYIANFYYGYFNGILQGRGDITQANKVVIVSRGVMVLLGSVAVILGYGLLGLGISSLIASLCSRIIARYYFFNSATLIAKIDPNASGRDVARILWHNASRMGIVQLGAFLIQRANILIASSFLGLATAASYGMTATVLMTLSGVAMVICHLQMPHMNALQASAKKANLRGVLGSTVIVASTIFWLGALILFFWGEDLLRLISSGTPLVPKGILILISVVTFLELNHSIAATYLTTTNKIPFLGAAIFSGIVITGLSFVLVRPFQLWGLVLAQAFTQLAYNNWKWPLEALKSLDVTPAQLIRDGVLDIKRIISGEKQRGIA